MKNLYVISVLASAGLFIGTSAISEFASRRAKSSSFQNRRAEWGHMKREQRELMRNSGKCLALLGFGYGCYRYGKRRELYEKTGD